MHEGMDRLACAMQFVLLDAPDGRRSMISGENLRRSLTP